MVGKNATQKGKQTSNRAGAGNGIVHRISFGSAGAAVDSLSLVSIEGLRKSTGIAKWELGSGNLKSPWFSTGRETGRGSNQI